MDDSEEDWDAPASDVKQKQIASRDVVSYGNHTNTYKESEGGNIEVLNIDSTDIGGIIGRGGANVKLLEEEYQVRLNLNKQSNVVEISGNNMHSVHKALERLKSNIAKNREQRKSNFKNHAPRTLGNTNSGAVRYGADNSRRNDSESYNKHNRRQFASHNSEETALIDWNAANLKSDTEHKKRWANCPKLTKVFYQEHREVTKLSEAETERIRAKNNNTSASRLFEDNSKCNDASSKDVPKPVWKFEHCFAAYPDMLEEIRKQGFESPSPIQAQAWPVILSGEDLIGIAQTGTGKTLAFLLPAMIHTEYQAIPRSQRGGPTVLVMAPTRELALQLEKEANKYNFRGMKAVCIYGGGCRSDQIKTIEEGAEIIICTPGRLNDLIQAKVIDVTSVSYLVLDEADRMLDMGFEPQIRRILLDIRPDRQTIMTSATWPPDVRRLAQSYMKNPIQVTIGSLDLAATHTVTQIVEIIEDQEKYQRVKDFIRNMQVNEKAIVFCGRKTRADDLSIELAFHGIRCQCIHGSRDQADREQAIEDITSGYVKVLIATDVASRGLDIADITHVINLDFPRHIEEYVHRVGRTGRAGRNGVSVSYLTRSDWGMAQSLIDILTEAKQSVPEELVNMAKRFKAMKDRRGNDRGRGRH